VDVVKQDIEVSTPWVIPNPLANPDSTPECQEIVKEYRQLRRTYTRTHDLEDWEAYKEARSKKKRVVTKALRSGHRDRVQLVTEQGLQGL
jgi:hypothetical protein